VGKDNNQLSDGSGNYGGSRAARTTTTVAVVAVAMATATVAKAVMMVATAVAKMMAEAFE
jgi:hypothetical protein